MKQTVPLLACLCALLLLVTGMLLVQNHDVNQQLIITQNKLTEACVQLEAAAKREAQSEGTVCLLKQQLEDALLSVEEANAAVKLQAERNAQLMLKLHRLYAPAESLF